MARSIPALALAALGMAAPASAQTPPPEKTTLTAAPDVHQRLTVQVSIGDKGPFRFLVDTGAQSTILSDRVAQALAIAPSGTAKVLGVAGQREVSVVALDNIQLGGRIWHGRRIPLLAGADLGADGVVGLDGLQNQRVLIDFARNRLTLVEADDPELRLRGFDIVVTARRQKGELILTNGLVDGVRADVVIDTGADISVGNPALQRALAQERAGYSATLHSATGQEINADIGMARQITIDAIRITSIPLAFTDSPTFAALNLQRRPALLLGIDALRLFKRIAIDFPRRRVMFALPPEAP